MEERNYDKILDLLIKNIEEKKPLSNLNIANGLESIKKNHAGSEMWVFPQALHLTPREAKLTQEEIRKSIDSKIFRNLTTRTPSRLLGLGDHHQSAVVTLNVRNHWTVLALQLDPESEGLAVNLTTANYNKRGFHLEICAVIQTIVKRVGELRGQQVDLSVDHRRNKLGVNEMQAPAARKEVKGGRQPIRGRVALITHRSPGP